jgi:hypothetical protein
MLIFPSLLAVPDTEPPCVDTGVAVSGLPSDLAALDIIAIAHRIPVAVSLFTINITFSAKSAFLPAN